MHDGITHRIFLFVMTQLMTCGQTKLYLGTLKINFHLDPESGKWILSTKVVSRNQKIANELYNCFCKAKSPILGLKNYFRFEEIDFEKNVYFEEKVNPINQYLYFKNFLRDFLSRANDWKEILI